MAAEIESILELSSAEKSEIEGISREAGEPLIKVANLYKIERTNLERVATIHSYVPVIASHQVRIKLKQSH